MSEPQQLDIEPLTPSRKAQLADELVSDLTLHKGLLEKRTKMVKAANDQLGMVAGRIEELRQELRKPVVLDLDDQEDDYAQDPAA